MGWMTRIHFPAEAVMFSSPPHQDHFTIASRLALGPIQPSIQWGYQGHFHQG